MDEEQIKKNLALEIEGISLCEEGSIYNWASAMYKKIFNRHHLEDFPRLRRTRCPKCISELDNSFPK